MLILEAKCSDQYSIFVDPQEQAISFIKDYLEHDKNQKWYPVKSNSSNLNVLLEHAIALGAAVICEEVGEL